MVAAPAELDEYKILRTLGRGGMGAVFLARDRLLDRLVAIKMIDRAGPHPDAVARFRIEARALARLTHANVVTVHRIGDHAGTPFIVYEYVEGCSLDQRPRPLAPAQAHAIGLGLVRGLAAAHREGILHRDLKPGNAMLALDGTVKLLDFGLAKLCASAPDPDAGHPPAIAPEPRAVSGDAATVAEPRRPVAAAASAGPPSTLTFAGAGPGPGPAEADSGPELTRAGSRMGTPRYMCPEAWRGEVLTAASDVYSLGLVLWELFADRHPFEGVALDALPARACDHDVPSLATAVTGLSGELVAAIDRCVRREPSARPVDAVELLAELEGLAPMAAVAPMTAAPAAAAAGRGARGWRRPALGGRAIVAVGGAAVAWWPRPRPRPAAVAAVVDAAVAAPAPAVAPVGLTRLGGCADAPVFVDEATIAFSVAKGEAVDVYTLFEREVTPIATAAGWDWRPALGRHPGEILYVRDGDDGRNRVVAYSRAAASAREVAVGYAVAAVGPDLYYLTDDALGEIHRRSAAGVVTTVAQLPAGRSPEMLEAAPGGGRLAVVASDRASPATVCIVELATPTPRCLPTIDLQVGRPAFSATGRYLYYPARAGIRRLDLEAGGDVVVAPGIRASGGVALSPDQTRLVYSDCRSYGSIVALGATAGAAAEVLIDDGLARHPRGGPGGLLGYIARRDDGGTSLMVTLVGAPARELVVDPDELGAPAFSPAGDRIAFSDSGVGGGLRVIATAGGPVAAWTTEPGDRGPIWTRAGGLAFTRLGAGGAPTAMVVTGPGAPARVLAAGWTVQDLDRATGAVLALRDGHVARLDLDRPVPGRPTPVRIGAADGTALAVVATPDGAALIVLGGASGGELFRVERATGVARLVHQAPAGQTVGSPTVLGDGRVAYRAEIWLGELYELPTPARPD